MRYYGKIGSVVFVSVFLNTITVINLAFAEVIFRGPTLATANGHPGVVTSTSIGNFERANEEVVLASVNHIQLQGSWSAKVEVHCKKLIVRFHPNRNIEFSVQLLEGGPVVELQNGQRFNLHNPFEYKEASEAANNLQFGNEDFSADLDAAHRIFAGSLQHFAFVAGSLTARACNGDNK